MPRGNLRDWILKMADGEAIEGIVLGPMRYEEEGRRLIPHYDDMPQGIVLSWDEAEKWLNYEFEAGLGSTECIPIWAWTKSWVIAIGDYDGATWPYRIPRHPADMMPTMEGGETWLECYQEDK